MTLLTPISTYYFTKSQFLFSKQFSNQLNGVFLSIVTTANLSHDSMWHAVSIFWAMHWTYFRDLPAEYLPEQCVQWSSSVMGVNIGLIIFFFLLFSPVAVCSMQMDTDQPAFGSHIEGKGGVMLGGLYSCKISGCTCWMLFYLRSAVTLLAVFFISWKTYSCP